MRKEEPTELCEAIVKLRARQPRARGNASSTDVLTIVSLAANSRELSVVICSHNPRKDYLERVLTALRGQTLPLDEWELLLIDNKSNVALGSDVDLSWHPAARIIREDTFGLSAGADSGDRRNSIGLGGVLRRRRFAETGLS